MTFLTGKHVDRRTLLKGVGAALALPALDAMRPALAAASKGAKQALRVAVVYVPNGIVMKDWKPAVGKDFAFTRILKPLEPFREDITVLSGLANHAANKARGGGHAKATGSFLSGTPPKYTAGADVRAGVTFDQIAAQHWASETRVPSLQIGCEDARMVGNCDTGSSCAYTNSLSWKNPETPLAVEVNPRSVFERLFGVADPHHPLTHHRGHPDFIEKVTKINCFHVELFAYFLERLKSTADGDGTLLDHSVILYGSALSDGNAHSNFDLPLVAAGHAGGIRGGRHAASEAGTPVANLFVQMLNCIGLETESFADSTGQLDLT